MKKLITFILLILTLNPFGLFSSLYKFTDNLFTNFILKHYGQEAKAIVIDEKNTIPNLLNKEFSYNYLFEVDGKKYKNNAADSILKIGDTIQVEYFRINPSISKPLHVEE